MIDMKNKTIAQGLFLNRYEAKKGRAPNCKIKSKSKKGHKMAYKYLIIRILNQFYLLHFAVFCTLIMQGGTHKNCHYQSFSNEVILP